MTTNPFIQTLSLVNEQLEAKLAQMSEMKATPSMSFEMRAMRDAPLPLLKGCASAAELANTKGLPGGWQARLTSVRSTKFVYCSPDGTCYTSLKAAAAASKHAA